MADREGPYMVLLLATWLIPLDTYVQCYKFPNTVSCKKLMQPNDKLKCTSSTYNFHQVTSTELAIYIRNIRSVFNTLTVWTESHFLHVAFPPHSIFSQICGTRQQLIYLFCVILVPECIPMHFCHT